MNNRDSFYTLQQEVIESDSRKLTNHHLFWKLIVSRKGNEMKFLSYFKVHGCKILLSILT